MQKKEVLTVLQQTGDPLAVVKQQINSERIKREVKHLVKNRTDDFVQNPYTLEFIAQKPTQMDPARPSEFHSHKRPATQSAAAAAFDPTRVDRIFKQKSMQRRIDNGRGIPQQRCKWQQTAAQEIGWHAEPLVPKNPEVQKPRKACQITQYADNYRLLKHKNPFSRDVHMYRDMPPVDANAQQQGKK